MTINSTDLGAGRSTVTVDSQQWETAVDGSAAAKTVRIQVRGGGILETARGATAPSSGKTFFSIPDGAIYEDSILSGENLYVIAQTGTVRFSLEVRDA